MWLMVKWGHAHCCHQLYNRACTTATAVTKLNQWQQLLSVLAVVHLLEAFCSLAIASKSLQASHFIEACPRKVLDRKPKDVHSQGGQLEQQQTFRKL